ncbi:MAG TPA: YceI family protein [Thermoanaerobaculia bacterium]|nr:YceI family protein [Thermoanaerobaculia bacterium]
MFRQLLILILAAAPAVAAGNTTQLVSGAPSKLVLQGSSNVAPWRCSGTTLDSELEVAAPLARINNIIDRIEDGNIAQLTPDTATFPQPSFRLNVQVTTLRCGNRQMERDMYRALRADAFPSIDFRFQNLVGGIRHDIDGGSYHATIAGVLSLAGARRNVTNDVEAQRIARDRFRLRAKLPLRMTDFRITPPTALFGVVKAKDDLVVHFDLILQESRS